MYIKHISIKNYRNFADFQTDFEPLTLITGANNSGKTNLFAALEVVLSLSSPRNSRVTQSDFRDPASEIVIEITFSELSDHDIAAFYHSTGLIDPTTNSLTIHFEAYWDADEQDVVSECYFMRTDIDDDVRRVDFIRSYRQYISSYFIAPNQSSESILSLSPRQSFGKVMRTFVGDYLKPFEVLVSHLNNSVQEVSEEINDLQENILPEETRNEIVNALTSVAVFCENDFQESFVSPRHPNGIIYELAECISVLASVTETVRQSLPGDDRVSERLESALSQLNVLEHRLLMREDMRRWGTDFQETEPFTAANEHLAAIFSPILRDQEISFQVVPVGDEDILRGVSATLDGKPMSEYGDGFKSLFGIGMGLADALSSDMKRQRASVTCLFIEEIESNLHPHMQRHMISQLRSLQGSWMKSDRHLQVVITTHSPSVLRKVLPSWLVQLRPNSNPVKWSNDTLDSLADQLETDSGKRRKILRRLQGWSERIFSDFAEAILGKVVIIVEGQTELGFISRLAQDVSDPDYSGISYINAEGGGEIRYVAPILTSLGIPYVAVADQGDGHNLEGIPQGRLFLTKCDAFEEEILSLECYAEVLEALDEYRHEDSTEEMLKNLRGNGFPDVYSTNDVIGCLPSLADDQLDIIKRHLDKGMRAAKSVVFGSLLAGKLGQQAPQTYLQAISKAELLAHDANNGS